MVHADGASGRALIDLQGGALVLWNFILKAELPAQLEHLIRVEDGHLVLSNCQLSAGAATEGGFAGDLIAFRSASTQPQPLYLDQPLFSFPTERPVCRLDHCILITPGRAIQAELGRGSGRPVALCRGRRWAGDRASARQRRQAPVRRRPGARSLHADLGTNNRACRGLAGAGAGAGSPLAGDIAPLRLPEPARPRGPRNVALAATRPRWKTGRCSGRPTTTPPKWTGSSRLQTDHRRPSRCVTCNSSG